MKKGILKILFISFITTIAIAQNSILYTPINIQNAIEKGTRTNDGTPGLNYWQNKSDYKITAEILPDSSYLIGEESITYYNNSPDSLSQLVVRLYQDIAKPGAVRDWYVGKSSLADGIILNYLIVDGDTLDVTEDSRDIFRGSTNLIIRMKNNKVAPKSTVNLQIGWEFEIPQKLKIRMGNYGNGNLYIAYWYPQMAVYDDIDGWDKVDYSGMVEFYNDFSNYDVTLKAPKGMVVWATGELQNGKEVFRKDINSKYEMAKKSDETIRIITQEDYVNGLVTANNEINEWWFVGHSVSDFTIATSTNFNWDGVSAVVDSLTGQRSLTDVIYQDSIIHYDNGAQYSKETIEYLSHEFPGYPYPYSHATAFCNGNRGGGMESPMMANNGAPSDVANHVGLIFHEAAHNYFPFMMGTNERKYAWMDEGWASFLPTDLVDKYAPEYDFRKRRIGNYVDGAGDEYDLPLITPSFSYKTNKTRLGFYDKPTTAYYELNELLGDEVFKKAMLTYIERWIGKHPIPQDFFNTFNSVAGEDLSWFWNSWFYEYGYPDLAIDKVEKNGDEISVVVKKLGKIPTRVNVVFEFIDGTIETISKPASVWKNGSKSINIDLLTKKILGKVILGHKYIADVNKNNNSVELND